MKQPAVNPWAEDGSSVDYWYARAKSLRLFDDDCEPDDGALAVSVDTENRRGAWVRTWTWVEGPDADVDA